MSEILAWAHDAADIPERGLDVERSATRAELAAITRELELISCDGLDARYRIKPVAGGGYRVSGSLKSRLAQPCIVTLEPVPAVVESVVEVEYWPEGQVRSAEEGEIEALSAAEIELLDQGRIDVGRVIFEQLAAALDPYPRKEGAEFEPPSEASSVAAEGGPFAALARLKQPKD